jgi:hypothetical protein
MTDANANNNNNNSEASNCLPAANNGSNQPSFIRDIDFEIVGLFSSSNGRFCCSHKVCGQHVCVGDVLRLVKTVVDIGEVTEEVPRVQSKLPNVIENVNKFCIVTELYHASSSNYKRKKGEKNQGMAGAILLNCIPINE